MTLPGKLLLAAWITAPLIFIAGYAAQLSTSRELDRLHLACLEQDKQQKLRSPSSSFTLDCDPRSLTATDDKLMRRYEEALGGSTLVEYHPSPGVQGDMVRVQRRLNLLRRMERVALSSMDTRAFVHWRLRVSIRRCLR